MLHLNGHAAPRKYKGFQQTQAVKIHPLLPKQVVEHSTLPPTLAAVVRSERASPADMVEGRIQRRVFQDRIRLLEFFRDFDRHNCGLITPSQFTSGLAMTSLRLSAAEGEALIARYRVARGDGRVRYRDFCAAMDAVFTTDALEADPLAALPPIRLETAAPEEAHPELTTEEEERCAYLLHRLSDIVAQERIHLPPFFKDFDRLLGSLGKVTPSHFARILSTMQLELGPEDVTILTKAFCDTRVQKVDYPAFIQAIDYATHAAQQEALAGTAWKGEAAAATPADRARPKLPVLTTGAWDLPAIHKKLGAFLASHQVRLAECFRDFDKLRKFSIPRHEFVRGVGALGCHFSEQALQVLADHYRDPAKPDCCMWKRLAEDMEAGACLLLLLRGLLLLRQ
jgi:Ca2+-binding EF-hand superfamily protein